MKFGSIGNLTLRLMPVEAIARAVMDFSRNYRENETFLK
jgi:hypothetical protein